MFAHNARLVNSRYYSVERERGYQNGGYSQDSEMESDPFVTWRPRRALPREYFIEIMVVADKKMVDYHGSGLISYILVLMSTVGTSLLRFDSDTTSKMLLLQVKRLK